MAAIDELIRVEEVGAAEFYVGDLFRRRFAGDPPDYPRHFVALYKAARNNYVAVGYIHYTTFEDVALVGGMVEDERALQRMEIAHRTLVAGGGGLAAKLFRDTMPRFTAFPALWALVAEPAQRVAFERAGFAPADDTTLMVKWNGEFAAAERGERIARVNALGAF